MKGLGTRGAACRPTSYPHLHFALAMTEHGRQRLFSGRGGPRCAQSFALIRCTEYKAVFLHSGILELWQEDGKFEASLGYTVSFRPSWATRPNVTGVGVLVPHSQSSFLTLPLAVTL